MGIFDKAKDLLSQHSDTVASGIDKAAKVVNERTGGQHAERIDTVSDQIKDRLEPVGGEPGAAQSTAMTEPVPPAEPEPEGPGPLPEPETPVQPSDPNAPIQPTDPIPPTDPTVRP